MDRTANNATIPSQQLTLTLVKESGDEHQREPIQSQNPNEMLEQARNYLQRVQLALRESTDFDEIIDIRDHGEIFRQ